MPTLATSVPHPHPKEAAQLEEGFLGPPICCSWLPAPTPPSPPPFISAGPGSQEAALAPASCSLSSPREPPLGWAGAAVGATLGTKALPRPQGTPLPNPGCPRAGKGLLFPCHSWENRSWDQELLGLGAMGSGWEVVGSEPPRRPLPRAEAPSRGPPASGPFCHLPPLAPGLSHGEGPRAPGQEGEEGMPIAEYATRGPLRVRAGAPAQRGIFGSETLWGELHAAWSCQARCLCSVPSQLCLQGLCTQVTAWGLLLQGRGERAVSLSSAGPAQAPSTSSDLTSTCVGRLPCDRWGHSGPGS